MTKLLSTAAAIALSIGAVIAPAQAAAPSTFVVAQNEKPAIAPATCLYRYQYVYVNGVLYYQYRYFCY